MQTCFRWKSRSKFLCKVFTGAETQLACWIRVLTAIDSVVQIREYIYRDVCFVNCMSLPSSFGKSRKSSVSV